MGLLSYVMARNLIHGDAPDLKQDLGNTPYIQHAVGWLDRYCFANTDKSFASALKLMVKEVEPE
ncbi:MAG TPA: hypothetical protein QGF63_16855 [Alphaproteobacteria bacterium]|nr:hypothetical protein [Alphaproteobacteria bacterium]HJM51501.1 hypothetical protein [Alphaproteobacteria bacterium]